MEVHVVKIDQYHEPEYYGFYTDQSARLFIEQHILERIANDPSASRECLSYLDKGDLWCALDIWAEAEGEYISVIPLTLDEDLCAVRLGGDLRAALYKKLDG